MDDTQKKPTMTLHCYLNNDGLDGCVNTCEMIVKNSISNKIVLVIYEQQINPTFTHVAWLLSEQRLIGHVK